MMRIFKLTFGSFWGWFGIIAGAISIVNLAVFYGVIEVGRILGGVLAVYNWTWHGAVDYSFFWVDWKLPFWLKDGAALYLVFGNAARRAEDIWDQQRDGQDYQRVGWWKQLRRILRWPRTLYLGSKNRRMVKKEMRAHEASFGKLHPRAQRIVEFGDKPRQLIWANMISTLLFAAVLIALNA